MEINLRDYQKEVYDGIKNEFKKGSKGVCCVLPCRSGKSYVLELFQLLDIRTVFDFLLCFLCLYDFKRIISCK